MVVEISPLNLSFSFVDSREILSDLVFRVVTTSASGIVSSRVLGT